MITSKLESLEVRFEEERYLQLKVAENLNALSVQTKDKLRTLEEERHRDTNGLG